MDTGVASLLPTTHSRLSQNAYISGKITLFISQSQPPPSTMSDANIPLHNRAHIDKHLAQIEKDHNVDILFAVESGSRMWGFASLDSDFDVRFVYRAREDGFYTSFARIGHPYKDTIQHISADRLYDYSGWDLPKFMRHLAAMNTSIIEWCRSEIIYVNCTIRDRETFQSRVRDYVTRFTQPEHLLRPYRGMLLSTKCCSLENVKRAMYTARILLVLDLVERGIKPAAFTWRYLLDQASWSEDEKAILVQLHAKKIISAEKNEGLPVEARKLLEGKVEPVRRQVSQVCTNPKEAADSDDDKGTVLSEIWTSFLYDCM